MTDRKEIFCKKCKKKTIHEHVRDLATYYWRCEICVNKALKHTLGIFIPPYINSRNRRANML